MSDQSNPQLELAQAEIRRLHGELEQAFAEIRRLTGTRSARTQEPIHPAMRAEFDRELSTAVDALVAKAANHDGLDVIEANVVLTDELFHLLSPMMLAQAAAALALRLHRSGGAR